MNIAKYTELTGRAVSSSKEALVTAQIDRTRRILEALLGFTLDPTLYNENQYNETGKTISECPCPSDTLTLDDPDVVVFAYRLYPYFRHDRFFTIDPASEIHAVKLIYKDVTYKTLDTDEFREDFKHGMIKYLEQVYCWYSCAYYCEYVQLAVDATWLWSDGNIPQDLMHVWAEMVTYYSDLKKDVRSQTLGPHSYTKFNTASTPPEQESHNSIVIKKYAGPLGNIKKIPTI